MPAPRLSCAIAKPSNFCRCWRQYRAFVTGINLGRDKVDGREIARHAKEIDPEFRVVYISGESAEDWATKGVPNSMLSKPFASAQLVTAVSSISVFQYFNSGTPTTKAIHARKNKSNSEQLSPAFPQAVSGSLAGRRLSSSTDGARYGRQVGQRLV
jgi:DNA-binding NarL/FixJ family response regulator